MTTTNKIIREKNKTKAKDVKSVVPAPLVKTTKMNGVTLTEQMSSSASTRAERSYSVKDDNTGKTYSLIPDTSGAFVRWKISGYPTAYETPAKAAAAVAQIGKNTW
jgi:hypothetical protein